MTNTTTQSIRRCLIFETPDSTTDYDSVDSFLDALNYSYIAKKSDMWNFDFFTGETIVSENADSSTFDWKLIPNKKFTVKTKKLTKNQGSPSSSSSSSSKSSSSPLSEKENQEYGSILKTPAKSKLRQAQLIRYMTSTHKNNKNGKKIENVLNGYIKKSGEKKMKIIRS
uniref:Cyclin-dependent kinase inhibitor domain-containing protein n=1 Tax=Strongyloides stercoralis TaxID=6248 RepID=A0AAF5DFW0_STRER